MSRQTDTANRELNERFDRLYGELAAYIIKACWSFSARLYFITAEDLRQEAAIKLLSIMKTNPDLPDNDIMKVFKTSLYNMLKDMYRNHKVTSGLLEHGMDMDGFEQTGQQLFDELVYKEYATIIRSKLSHEIDRALFDLIMHPDEKTVKLASKRQAKKQKEREAGKLVLDSEEVWVTEAILAQRLDVSPATISRSLKRIKVRLSEAIFGPR